MGKKRRHMPPFEGEVTGIFKGGCGIGTTPDGQPYKVKFGAPGSRLQLHPMGKRKGVWQARKVAMIRPPVHYQTPKCSAFGLCGGCSLQELKLEEQRRVKEDYGLSEVANGLGWSVETLRERVTIHPMVGAKEGYEYRNKVELSFGPRRFLSEEAHGRGEPITGRFLGFHASGRFDRVAEVSRCWLVGEGTDALIRTLGKEVLTGSDAPLWDSRSHEGFWRHALFRAGRATGEHLVALYTTSDTQWSEDVERVANALLATSMPNGERVNGVIWIHNDGVADVARGTVARVWGKEYLEETLQGLKFRLSVDSFFQTSTTGAEVLYDVIRQACGKGYRTLYDLYCGTGSIGLALAGCARSIVGVEEVESSVLDARENARRNGIENTSYRASKMKDALDVLAGELEEDVLVVDPPRVGLHPQVSNQIAGLHAQRLVYVACKPGSLGRDARIFLGRGWELTDLWSVDLFPQTGHLEMVGAFRRRDRDGT